MTESLHAYMQVGLIHFMAYPSTMQGQGPIVQTLRQVAVDDYFDAVEVTHIHDPGVRAQAKAMLAQSHLTVCYGAQPRLLGSGLNPNDLDEAGRKQAEALLIASIDEAHELGATGIGFLAGHWDKGQKDACYAQLVKTTRALCNYAKPLGMQVELEVFDYDLDKKSLIGPAPYAAKFAAQMRSEVTNFGLIVDLSHLPQTYEDAQFALRVMRPYITHLHIGSAVLQPGAVAFGDTHPRFGFLHGVNDVPEVAEFLQVCLDEGILCTRSPMVLSFEVKPWEDETPDIVIANAKRVLNRAWALVEQK